jgi:hypothetical protein
MADVLGFGVLALMVAAVAALVPTTAVAGGVWPFGYAIWALCAWFVWHHPSAPKRPLSWLFIALLSLVVAPLWYGVAVLAALFLFSGAEPQLSRAFDISITFLLAPGLTFIFVSGSVRAYLQERKKG